MHGFRSAEMLLSTRGCLVRGGLSSVAILVAVVAASVNSPALCQTKEPPVVPDSNLEAIAQQMPECKEFRNACQVCVRLADGKLGCSNIGVACTPSCPWQCSAPSKPADTTK
jgi:hypothetical protein